MRKVTRHKPRRCRVCLHDLSASTPAADDEADAVPKPGCITVCLYCGTAYVFTEGLNLRLLTAEDCRDIAAASPEAFKQLCAMQAAVKEHRASQNN